MANKLNPALDLLSPKFDPGLALTAEQVTVPYPDVKPLNNISECRRLLPVGAADAIQPEDVRASQQSSSLAGSSTGQDHRPSDDRDDDELATGEVGEKRSARPRLAGKWQTLLMFDDSLSWIRRLLHKRVRVVVLRGREKPLCGWVDGTLELFDPRLNVVLRRAIEHFVELEPTSCSGDAQHAVLWRKRSVPQLLLRGDCVVSIRILPHGEPSYGEAFMDAFGARAAGLKRPLEDQDGVDGMPPGAIPWPPSNHKGHA